MSNKVLKIFIAAVVVILICAAAINFFLPTRSAPQDANTTTSTPQDAVPTQPIGTDCTASDAPIYAAYQVTITTRAKAAVATVYQSKLQFDAQLQERATGELLVQTQRASVHEGGIDKPIADALFSGKLTRHPYVQINQFDVLQLPAKHPLQAVAQFAKALSVGENLTLTQYPYDALAQSYLYKSAGQKVSRDNISANQYPHHWHAVLNSACQVESIDSLESQPIQFVGTSGMLEFVITAKRIDNFADLSQIQLRADANAENFWTNDEINAQEFAAPVTSMAEYQKLLASFDEDKNTARLARGAEFILNNIPASEIANLMIGSELTSAQKRVLAYSLSLTDNPNTQNYLLDVIGLMPPKAGDNIDVQTMRLMVSLSGYKNIDTGAFAAMQKLSQSPAQSENVRSNATLAMATMLPTLNATGQNAGLSAQFSHDVSRQINDNSNPDSQRTAILAIGNAKLQDPALDQLVLGKLQSPNADLRYASVKVLATQPQHYDAVIASLANEQQTVVISAATRGLDAANLSPSQRSQLQQIANAAAADSDKAKLINHLLQTPTAP